MLRALRQARGHRGHAETDHAGELEARRLTSELMRLREREAARAEEVDSRNAFLRAFARQLGHPLAALSATLAAHSHSHAQAHSQPEQAEQLEHDWLDRRTRGPGGLTRLARHLDAASNHLGAPANLALASSTWRTPARPRSRCWRGKHQRRHADVRVTSAAPVHGLWDTKRLQA